MATKITAHQYASQIAYVKLVFFSIKELSNLSILRYPNSELPMAVVTFDQDFHSNVLDSQMRKRQYWIFENQQWKIIYEGAA